MTSGAAERRLVILTRERAEHRYVANRLCQELPIEAIVVDVAGRPASLRRAFRGGLRSGVARVGLEAFRRIARDRAARVAGVRRILGAELTESFLREDAVKRVAGINSRDAVEFVRQKRPHALLVFGTTIVRDEMLAQASEIAFNLHTGVSPYYRGTDCAFWPLANREPDRLGATVHECTSAVDGGPIFAVGAARYDAGDGIHEVFARAVAFGAELYVDVVRRYLRGELQGVPQDLSVGREYRGYMRTLAPELKARWFVRRGLLREPSR